VRRCWRSECATAILPAGAWRGGAHVFRWRVSGYGFVISWRQGNQRACAKERTKYVPVSDAGHANSATLWAYAALWAYAYLTLWPRRRKAVEAQVTSVENQLQQKLTEQRANALAAEKQGVSEPRAGRSTSCSQRVPGTTAWHHAEPA
jgi:hypothetical protein